MNSKKWIIQYIEVLLDILVMFASYLVANWYKFGFFRTGLISHSEHYLTLFLLELVAYVIVHFIVFADDDLIQRKLFSEIFNVAKMYIYVGAITVGCIYFTKTSEYFSRGQMAVTFILSTLLTVITRQLLKRLVTKEYHRSGANEKIMLVTTSDEVKRVIKKIKTTRNWDFRISNIAILDCDMTGEVIDKIDVVACRDTLLSTISTSEVDSIFVHIPDSFLFDKRQLVEVLNEMGKTVHLNINDYETKLGETYLDFLGKYAVVTCKSKTYRFRHVAIKRLGDIFFGLLGSLLTVPVWFFAFIGKLLTKNKGPVIVSLVRVGKSGRRFYYYKFRTMYIDANERYIKWVNDGSKGSDPRYTPVGRVLRMLRIENLPTAWNVLWGDMSMVGNMTPSLPEFIEYSVTHRKSLSIKPGIIGYWQVYNRENRLLSEEEQCDYDQEYILKWTVGLDLRIIFRAIFPLCRTVSKRTIILPVQQKDEMELLDRLRKESMPLAYDDTYAGVKAEKKLAYKAIKRTVDIVAALCGIIVLLPIFAVLSVVIRLSDGGSVFYGHTRIGYKGKKISVYKFRSMKTNAGDLEKLLTAEQLEQYLREFKIDNDPRITKIGGFLRKTSIDELPQLLNILKGELSIVGPRPIVEKETQIYGKDIAKLLSVKPGLTGYWQAYARNNATYETGERQRMEMYYVDNCSLWLDIKILFKTVLSVLKRDGAQ